MTSTEQNPPFDVTQVRDLAEEWGQMRTALTQRLNEETLPTFDRRVIEVSCERFRIGQHRVRKVVGLTGSPPFKNSALSGLTTVVRIFRTYSGECSAAGRRKNSEADSVVAELSAHGWERMAQSLDALLSN